MLISVVSVLILVIFAVSFFIVLQSYSIESVKLTTVSNNKLVNEHVKKFRTKPIRLEKEIELPLPVLEERDRLLAEADTKIRSGLAELAKKFPQLQKAKAWGIALNFPSDKGRVGIYLYHTDRGKIATQNVISENDQFGVTVSIGPPCSEPRQLSTYDLYPRLGLVGYVGTSAGNSDLDMELRKLIINALAPLEKLEKKQEKVGFEF